MVCMYVWGVKPHNRCSQKEPPGGSLGCLRVSGAIGVVGKRCIELMERKCNMAKLLHLGVNTLNTAEGKTFWASLQECADFTDVRKSPPLLNSFILTSILVVIFHISSVFTFHFSLD